jgi:hypothetical protein
MTDDLVKDLHSTKLFDADGWESGLGKEAADEITRLRAENKRMQRSLATIKLLSDCPSSVREASATLAELKGKRDE